jgi:hypothetical protein
VTSKARIPVLLGSRLKDSFQIGQSFAGKILLIFELLIWAKLCENTWKKYMKRSIFLPAGVGVGILGCMLALQALL